MTGRTCGCTNETCGCCEGTRKLTPASTYNRPGQEALAYRVGTHGTFFETMKARLSEITCDAPGADGQTIETFQPLRGLTTRNVNDPAIALLDSWATVGDVLTFYQERIANEGYLRTATERRSILELARLVGYTVRPGVAASVFLAYTLEDRQTAPVTIPAGARSQSVPGPGELPQAFETSEDLIAHAEWNNLQVRLERPQNITLDNVMSIESLYVAGTNTNLKTGEKLLLVFGKDDTERMVLRTVLSTDAQFDKNRTEIKLQPELTGMSVFFPFTLRFLEKVKSLAEGKPADDPLQFLLQWAERLVNAAAFGVTPDLKKNISDDPKVNDDPQVTKLLEVFGAEFTALRQQFFFVALAKAKAKARVRDTTDPSKFIGNLLKTPVRQATSSVALDRKLGLAFAKGADAQSQLLIRFAPELKDSLYVAWASANVNPTTPALTSVHAFRATAPLFGANVAKQPTYFQNDKDEGDDQHFRGELRPQGDWLEWKIEDDETNNAMFLDQAHEAILPGSYVIIETLPKSGHIMRQVKRIDDTRTAQRTAYGLSSPTTKLTFEDDWWDKSKPLDAELKQMNLSDTIRRTLIYGQSEEFTVVNEPILDPIGGAAGRGEIELDALYHELTSGRWIILSGERADIPGVTGVQASELLMIGSLRQDFQKDLPGDKTHTTLLLATPTAYAYKRDSLKIYGNVVKATHGETRKEPLGNGDGSQALQTFELKQSPLTFVPAPTPSGVASTLKIYVNGIEWHEVDALAGSKSKDRVFVTKTDDFDKTTVIFGNGKEGSRLPSGVLNVESGYRNGIGKGGNVLAQQISLLQTRPLGVKEVINPQRASGGANRETRDQARENAPLAVMALDRLVSLQDYADFTRTFAGIAKAIGKRLSDRTREFIHITIAGVDDIPIDPVSDLYRNLLAAFRKLGNGSVAVQVDSRELIMLVLSANVRLEPDYLWEPVATAIRITLLDRFGFDKRSLGQPALLCEIVASIQRVTGVAYVDVDVFGGVAEKKTDENGIRRLQTPDEISKFIEKLVKPPVPDPHAPGPVGPEQAVIAELAGTDAGVLHPAQLAIFTPAVPDLLVLNQIK